MIYALKPQVSGRGRGKESALDILCFWWGNFNHGWTRMNTDAVGQF